MPAAKTKTAPKPLLNTFTTSYKIRYVVHGSRKGDELTLCGRQIDNQSKEPFDPDVEGACQKCIQKTTIEQRIHPGWAG